ncbi:MAG: TolB family protein [Actinomycetota bacterium]
MPEMQEVFRMATQKVHQDPGALDRQVAKQRKAVRNRRLSVFATVLVLVAGTVAAYALTRGDSGNVPANGATISIGPGAGPGTMIDLLTGHVTPLPASIATSGVYYAVSPDRTTVAYSTCCNPPEPLVVANVDGTQVRQISASGQDAFGAQWSPDGSMLLYQQRDGSTQRLGNLFVQDVATGQRTRLTNFETQPWDWWFTFPSFAPDGQSILFQLPRGGPKNPIWDLWSVPVAGGEQTLVQHNAGWGGYSPDGSQLAYLSPVSPHDFTGGELWLTGAHGGTPRALITQGFFTWVRWSPDGTKISYSDDGSIYVLDVATGSATRVAEGGTAEWFDDHTLIVGTGG